MSVYCGTDIIEVERIKNAIISTKGFKEEIFTNNEIKEIEKITSDYKYQRYAGRFVAKEAVYKAISKILYDRNMNLTLNQIEILNVDELKRRPKVNFLINISDIEVDVSISHIKENAIAMAIAKERCEKCGK